MKIDLREKYAFIGELPVEKEKISVFKMLTADDYFPHNTLFLKKVLYVFLRVFQKLKNVLFGNPKIKPKIERENAPVFNDIEDEVTFVVPIFSCSNIDELEATIESIVNQLYVIKYSIKVLSSQINLKSSIKVDYVDSDTEVIKSVNSHIGFKTDGYVCIVPCNDKLASTFVYSLDLKLRNTQSGFGYSNDIIGNDNKFFKPEFSPDTLRCFNYIGDVIFCKRSLFVKVNGLNLNYLMSYPYHFNLVATDVADEVESTSLVFNDIYPIREFSIEQEKQILQDYLKNKGELFTSINTTKEGHFIIDYSLKKEALISIIIPTKNRADILSVCLKSIFEKSIYTNFEVIVVDNNSDEESLFELLSVFELKYSSRFKVIKDAGVFNFARLMNEATKEASGEYYLFLNNDTEVISDNCLEELLKQSQRDDVGVVGPKLLYPNDLIQHCGVTFTGEDSAHVFVEYNPETQINHGQVQSIWNYPALTAACFMVSKEKFNAVNGFDETFAVSYNDIDLCLRLAKEGWRNVYIPIVSLYHYESISRGNPLAIPKTQKQHIVEYNTFVRRWEKMFN